MADRHRFRFPFSKKRPRKQRKVSMKYALSRMFLSIHGGGNVYVEAPNSFLGQGGFGKVTHAMTPDKNVSVALKSSLNSDTMIYLTYEREMLKRIRRHGGHPNVIGLLDVAIDMDRPHYGHHLVLQKCDMDVKSWMEELGNRVTSEVCSEISRQLYSGVAFLHHIGIIHRDLNRRNVLVHGFSGHVKIVDFGAAIRCPPVRCRGEDGSGLLKRGDLWSVTRACVLPVWMAGSVEYLTTLAQGVLHFRNQATESELLSDADHIIAFRPKYVCSTRLKRGDATVSSSWNDDICERPGRREQIIELHSWTLTHPPEGGHPIPEALHSALRYGCMLGSAEQLTARNVSTHFNDAIPKAQQVAARRLIRDLTVDLKSTTV
ncbi:cyclin-dependent kinase 5 homolog [Sycon ciliatum]|uniref:cyclin-dependent kinase 5 homolog n=1 Tax=Sycon ciliatum TaxID=27933 RepID=UPI0031F70E96